MAMTPDKYWQYNYDPTFVYGEGSTFAGMGWVGLHGEYVQVVDGQTVMQSQCDVCPPPATGYMPPGSGQPPVPLKYMTPDDMRWYIANGGGAASGPAIATTLVPPGYMWFGGAFKPTPGVGADPNTQFIWNDLLAAGLAPQDIQLYGLEAQQYIENEVAGDPALVGINFDWAAKYAAVLQFVNTDHPDVMQHLAQKLPPSVVSASQQWAMAQLTQAQQAAAGSKFDHFMANFGPFLLIVPFAIAVAPAVLAAGAANAATSGAVAATSIDAATAAQIGSGWEAAAAESSLQNAALAAAGGDAAAQASLVAAVGADQAAAMIADATSLLSTGGAVATAGTAVADAVPAAAAPAAATPGESAATLLSEAKTAAGVVSTAVSYGQKLAAILSGHPAAPPTAVRPAQAGLAIPGGIANNFPLLLGGAALLAIVVKKKSKHH
jgi:hypothetical protein